MAGFFRRVAGAFVELPDEGRRPLAPEPDADEVADLLLQLESVKAEASVEADAVPAPGLNADPLDLTADQAQAAAGFEDGPNSAHRLLTMVERLANFPPEQQLAMVRALDAADASWNEGTVLADARARQQALRSHLDAIERQVARQTVALGERAKEAQSLGSASIADIDHQIEALRQLRQEALTETAQVMAGLDDERRALDAAADRSRKSTTAAADRLSSLIAFFAGKGPANHG